MEINPQFYCKDTEVKLTKLEASVTITDMLETGYWLIGHLATELKVGEPITVLRHTRNGIKVPGVYISSPIVKIEKDLIHTQNSIWKIERV